MRRPNRDWKTFGQRWSGSGRFEIFLALSILVHLGVAVLVSVPSYLAQEKRQEQVQEEERRREEIKKEKEKIVEDAKEEVKEKLKEEIAADQLKQFFSELTDQHMTPEMARIYWDELLEELNFELIELAEMLQLPEMPNANEIEAKIQQIKEEMVKKLAEMVARDQSKPVRDELRAKSGEMARQLADFYRRELGERVGKPVGDELNKLVQAAEREGMQALQKADQALANLQQAASQARQQLEKGEVGVRQQKQALDAAEQKKDTKAIAAIKAQLRKQKTDIDVAGKQLERIRTDTKTVADQLAPHLPGAADHLRKADSSSTSAAQQQAKAASQAVAEGKPAEAMAGLQASRAGVAKTAEAIRRAQAAVQLQQAAEQTARLARETAGQARTTEELTREQKAAGKSGDSVGKERAGEKLAAMEKQVQATEGEAGQLGQRLAQAKETARGVEKSAGPSGKPEKPSANPTARLDKAKGELKQGREALASKAPEKAAEKLAEAARQLNEVGKEIQAAQAELGIQGNDSAAQELLAQLDQLRQTAMAQQVQQRFEQAYRDRALPTVLQRLDQAADRALRSDPAAAKQVRTEIQKEMQQRFGQELVKQVNARDRFAQAAGAKLPPGSEKAAGATPQKPAPAVAGMMAKAEAGARRIMDTQVPKLVDDGLRQAGVTSPTLQAGGPTAQQADLASRLKSLQGQLAAGRKDFLGQADSTRLAAARQRMQDRQFGLGRLGTYVDLKTEAYRELAKQILERGQVVGEDFIREKVTGETATATEETPLRPAQVVVPEEVKIEPEEKPASRPDQPRASIVRFAGVPFVADDAIKIDGDLSDWKEIQPLLIDQKLTKASTVKEVADPPQKAYLAWCSKGLLFGALVIDPTGKIEDHWPLDSFWLNDCVEIYIDTLNTKDDSRGEANTHQFYAFPFGQKDNPAPGGYESLFTKEAGKLNWKLGVTHAQEVMPRAGKKTEQGWSLEVLIPKSQLRRGEVRPGRIIGFNVQIDVGHPDIYYYWSCLAKVRTSMHPKVWGEVQLLGSDARIDIVGEDEKTPQKTINPGQPVRVRVTDPDMNQDDRARDKVSVTLRTNSGDTKTLILEETENGSGVFLGAIATRLNIGARQPNVVEVFEGERISVEYIDQARRSEKERNVPVKSWFAVTAIGTRLASQ